MNENICPLCGQPLEEDHLFLGYCADYESMMSDLTPGRDPDEE